MDVAFVPELRFPTGNATSFLGGNGFIFAPRIDVETAFGPVRLLLDVGLRYRSTGQYLQLIVENEFTGGGAVIWALPSGKVFQRPELILETTFSTPLSAAVRRQHREHQRLGDHALGVPPRRPHALRQALGR